MSRNIPAEIAMGKITPEVWIAVVLGLAAIAEDLKRRQISNWIPIAALIAGLGYHTMTRGLPGLGLSLAGAVGGFVVFLIFYILGGMGGGDVKLMGGFGALLAWGRLLQGALFTAIIGGLIAAGVIGWRAIPQLWRKDTPKPDIRAIPYAPAIALGVWLALLPDK